MRTALVVWGVLLVGAAGLYVALNNGGGQKAFRSAQSASIAVAPPGVLGAPRVEAAVARAPEPVPAARRTPAVKASCRPEGGGTVRNPWACTVRYRSGMRAHYLVQIQSDGLYTGAGTGSIEGCCIKLPTPE